MAKAARSSKSKGGTSAAPEKPERIVVARNRRALHRFVVLEKLECGIILTGPEVKSLRNSQVVITDAFGRVRGDEMWLLGMEIAHYQPAFHVDQLAKRTRKLLLNRREIRKWKRRLDDAGTTLVPLQVYFTHGLAKVEMALARGAREHDKREKLKTRTAQREMRAKLGAQPRGRKQRRE